MVSCSDFSAAVPDGAIERLVIVPGEQVEHDVGEGGMAGAQRGFRIAGAILEFEPDERRVGWSVPAPARCGRV